jgi:hypothetical protein
VEGGLRILGVRGWKTTALTGTYGGGQDPHRVVVPLKKIYTSIYIFDLLSYDIKKVKM